MNKKDLLVKLHGYVASDGGIYTMKVKDMHGKKLRIRRKLRTRFMTCLNYRTPKEAFDIEMSKLKLKKPQRCGMMTRGLLTNLECSA